MRRLALLVVLLLALAPAAWAEPPVALLVVGNRLDAAVLKRENQVVADMQARRKKAGLSAAQLPILVYHVDIPAERKYCEGRLGIRADQVLFVGLARQAADRLPREVLDGRARVADASAALPYIERALAQVGMPAAATSPEKAYVLAAAAGDVAMQRRDYTEAAHQYGEASRLRTDDWRMASQHASALVACSRWMEAEAVGRRALAVAPTESLPHGVVGLALAGKGENGEAARQLQMAVDLSPKWAVPHAWRGQLALSLRDVETARREAGKAVELDPKLALAHYVLGTAGIMRWTLDDAIGHLRSAVTFEPSWTSPLDMLGWAYVLAGRTALADAAYQKLATLTPASSAPWLGLALSHHACGDDAGALPFIQKARGLSPRDATVVAVHAFVLGGLGRGQEAQRLAQEAVLIDTRNPNAWEALGLALAAQQQWRGALDDYARAEAMLRGWPEPELPYRQAIALYGDGQRGAAVARAEKLVREFPGSPWAERARALLRQWGRDSGT